MGPAEVTEFLQGPGFDGGSGPDDRHPVAELFHFAEDVAGQQHRGSVTADPLDVPPEDGIHDRIQAGAGFVQQIKAGRPAHRRDERHFLPVALGVRPDLLAGVQLEVLH